MSLTYGGVTPTVVAETTYLQYTEHVARDTGGGLVRGHGVCLTLVFDWVAKCKLHGSVTDASQLKSGLSLTLAHTNYLLDIRKMKESEASAADLAGAGLGHRMWPSQRWRSGRWGNPVIKLVTKTAGIRGFAKIAVFGSGAGHAFGYRNADVTEFFDPNVGILQFESPQEYVKWAPDFLNHVYPFLLEWGIVTPIA